MAAHTYSQHLADNGTIAPAVVDRDDGAHLLVDAPEVVAWLAAGNTLLPAPVPTRTAYGDDLIRALTDDEVAALGSAKARDQRLLSAQRRPFPENSPKIARLAAAVKTTPAAWFDVALNPPAATGT